MPPVLIRWVNTAFVTFATFVALMALAIASAARADATELAGPPLPQGGLESHSTDQDKALVAHFCKVSADGQSFSLSSVIPASSGFKLRTLTPGSLSMRRLYFKANDLSDMHREMRDFAIHPMQDQVGQAYVAFATARGNTVRQFKPAMGEALNKLFERHLEFNPARISPALQRNANALIEYTPDGQIVSLMTMAYPVIPDFNTRTWEYVNVVFGRENGRQVEDTLPVGLFSETFTREFPAQTPRAQ